MKKGFKVIICLVAIAVAVWLAMFATDYSKTVNLEEPVFATPVTETADDGGSGTFRGLGYTVEVEKYLDAEFGLKTVSVEMKIFGKVVAAAIE